MNKLFNPVFKTIARPQFYFSSAKNKSIELTLRTPYSITRHIKELLSRILLVSAKLSPRISTLLLSSKTDHHQLCTSFPLDLSDLNWPDRWRELPSNTSILEDGPQSTRISLSTQWQLSRNQLDGRRRQKGSEGWSDRQSRNQRPGLTRWKVHLEGEKSSKQEHLKKISMICTPNIISICECLIIIISQDQLA